jgi:hypothetical protein
VAGRVEAWRKRGADLAARAMVGISMVPSRRRRIR